MTAHFEKPTSRFGRVEWTLMCPIESYSLIRSISAKDANSINRRDNLLINGRVRYPDELHDHHIQIDIWKTDKQIVGNENPPNLGIGGLTFIGASEVIEEDSFYIHQPIQPSFFEDIVQSFLSGYNYECISHEIHLNVIGLLNKWDRKGALDVTEFKFVSTTKPLIKSEPSSAPERL